MIVRGLSEEHRRQAAELYYTAFARKLEPILGDSDRTISLFETSFDGERAITAIDDEGLVGIAGLHHDGRQLAGMPMRSLLRAFGVVRGAFKGIVLGVLFDRTPRKGELVMDGIAVAERARGRGVGTRLLHEVIAYARDHGFATVRLDVVDSNPRARALYERFGFVAVRTEQTPYLKRWLGFGAATTMVADVATAGHSAPDGRDRRADV